MFIEKYVWQEGTLKNEKSRMEVAMKRVNFKWNDFRTVFVTTVLFTFSHVNGLALVHPSTQDDANAAFFAAQSDDANDGFASRQDVSRSKDTKNKADASKTLNTQTKLEIRNAVGAEDLSDAFKDESDNSFVKLEDMPDWQLIHSAELPFGDYFIDTRIVGAVRYHADYSLENEYGILRELANIQKDLSQYLAIPHPMETIEVFFFQSQNTYKKFLGKELQDAPFDREALYYKHSGPGMVLIYQKPDMMEDLRHEMTHAFLHASLHYVPLWLDEGLAEYFEKPRETRARENPYFSSISRKIMFGQTPSLTKLEKMRFFDQMGVNEYCEAWSWVHFMMHYSRETHQTLAGYLRLLAKQKGETPSLDLYLAASVPDVKKAYIEHFRNWKNRNNSNARNTTAPLQSPVQEAAPVNETSASKLSLGWSESVFR